MADLTRDEARERAGLLTVQSYEVDLDFTRGDTVFGSTSVIRFTSARVGAETVVDLIAEHIHQATLNGAPVDLTEYADGRLPLRDLEADNILAVTADYAYTNQSTGVHRAVDQADGKIYLYTMLCPAEARRVFANFDQPDLKATFTYAVTAPAHWVVLSNAAAPEPTPVEVEGSEDGAVGAVARWQFPPTPRLSAYVTAIVAGEYAYVQQPFTTRRGQVIPLGVACRASLAEYLEPEDMFAVTGQGLDFYTDLFDMDFPFTKYDQIFVPEFAAGAMENAACVTFSESFLFRSKVTSLLYESRAMVTLHEMAHMWFGDYVTMRWWGDIWLNESFAEFCGFFACVEATQYRDAWTSFASQRKTWGYTQDQLPTTHPVVSDAPTINAVLANFDGISYAKGASVLKQLVAYVGADQFFAGVRAYFAEHAWANAEFADLLRAVETASGKKDLRQWAAVWLETSGPNTLRAEFEVDGEGRYTSFAVRQEAPAEYPTLRPHHIATGLYDLEDGALRRVARVEIDAESELTPVPEFVGRAGADVVLLNDEDLGYALTRFDPRSLEVLTEHIGTFEHSLNRVVAWTAVMDMAKKAELSIPDFVRMLGVGLRAEMSISVLQTMHRRSEIIIRQFADPAWLPSGLAGLAAVAIEAVGEAEPGGDFQLAWVQMLGWTAITDEQLDLVQGLLEGTTTLPGLEVDTGLRWTLLHRLVATGRVGAELIDAEQERDATDAGTRHARAARAAVPDAGRKAEAWALLTESEELGHQGIAVVSAGFGEALHAELLAPYAVKYFEFLSVLAMARHEQVRMRLAEQLFPFACAGDELMRLIEDYLAGSEVEPGLRRVVVEAQDLTRQILRSRAL
ncbi:MAG TPA: aminopeptidase N [Actinocrinis sp.]|nr:aminopeptidase N [Actinocrinis sp.]